MYYYAFHGRVTLFFANNSLTERGSPWNFYTIFLTYEIIFCTHTMFINTSTREFTLVNNAIPSHNITFEHLLYYKMVANVY